MRGDKSRYKVKKFQKRWSNEQSDAMINQQTVMKSGMEKFFELNCGQKVIFKLRGNESDFLRQVDLCHFGYHILLSQNNEKNYI